MAVNECIGRWFLDDPWTYPESLIHAKIVSLLRRSRIHPSTKFFLQIHPEVFCQPAHKPSKLNTALICMQPKEVILRKKIMERLLYGYTQYFV